MKTSFLIILICGYIYINTLSSVTSWITQYLPGFKQNLKLDLEDFDKDNINVDDIESEIQFYREWLYRKDLDSLWDLVPKDKIYLDYILKEEAKFEEIMSANMDLYGGKF